MSLLALWGALLSVGCSDDSEPSTGTTAGAGSAATAGASGAGVSGAGAATNGGAPGGSGAAAAGDSSQGGTAGSGALAGAGGSAGGTFAGAGGSAGTAPGGAGAGAAGTDAGGMGGEAGQGGMAGAAGDGTGGMAGSAEPAAEWLPSWATTIQTTEPNNAPPPLGGKTLRQFVWPTYSGEEIRVQLSNEKGTSPVELQKVHIAMAKTGADAGNSQGQIDTATDTALTFDGMANVTIPAGETVWSDAVAFELQEVRLTAITMQFGAAVPGEVTGHPGARTTSYVGDGDVVSSEAVQGETRDRWYFIDAIEVMAPADAYAIAVLGDSITDGYGILNDFARWPDFMTVELKKDATIGDKRSVLNFGMGANNLTVTDTYQDSGVVRFERDVLGRDKIKWLIVMEGVNDMTYNSVGGQALIDAYSDIIARAHAKGILVYGSPITPCSSCGARSQVNEWIRNSGEYDAVIDLAAPISNGDGWNAMFQNDDLHPNRAGYEAMGKAVDMSLFYELMP